MPMVMVRLSVAGVNCVRWFSPLWIMPSAYPTDSPSCSAKGVGTMPPEVRKNSSSPKMRRSLASALLTAGCVSPRLSATFDTRRSTMSC